MFYVALAQTVAYTDSLMKRLEASTHFIRGALLVTDLPPSVLEPVVKQTLAAADPNLTVTTVRTLQVTHEVRFTIQPTSWLASLVVGENSEPVIRVRQACSS